MRQAIYARPSAEAADFSERALVAFELSLGPEQPEVAGALASAAAAALATGNGSTARPWAMRAITLCSAFLGTVVQVEAMKVMLESPYLSALPERPTLTYNN